MQKFIESSVRYILLNYNGIFIRFMKEPLYVYVMYRVSISHCEITSQSEVRGNCDSRDTDEEFFYRGEVMVLALCQVWVNDVTAGGITSVTKSARSGAVRVPRSVISPIRKVEDRIVYVRDKRVGLSIINQFASTRQQLGNYIFPFYRELWNHSSCGSRRSRVRTGSRKWTAPQFYGERSLLPSEITRL